MEKWWRVYPVEEEVGDSVIYLITDVHRKKQTFRGLYSTIQRFHVILIGPDCYSGEHRKRCVQYIHQELQGKWFLECGNDGRDYYGGACHRYSFELESDAVLFKMKFA